jgi:hypothetical protein
MPRLRFLRMATASDCKEFENHIPLIIKKSFNFNYNQKIIIIKIENALKCVAHRIASHLRMSFMTCVIFTSLAVSIITSIGFFMFDNGNYSTSKMNADIFYMLGNKNKDDDSLTICAYSAIIAAIVLPHIPQID